MSRRPAPLPESLAGTPFSVRESAAAGVTRKRTRAQDLQSPFYGVRVSTGPLDLLTTCRATATRLARHAAFSHVTAARLHALPLPPRLLRDPVLHVTVPTGKRAPRGKRIRGHECTLGEADVDRRSGVKATTPVRTFCDLAGVLSLAELVAVGDQLIRRGTGPLSIDELRAQVSEFIGRSRTLLHHAVDLLDDGSESPKESELRVIIITAGLPRPECNVSVFDPNGRFVARVDLSYPDRKIAVEYEGDHHRDPVQWRKDLARRRRLEALGWTYLSVTQADLTAPQAMLADLRTALNR